MFYVFCISTHLRTSTSLYATLPTAFCPTTFGTLPATHFATPLRAGGAHHLPSPLPHSLRTVRLPCCCCVLAFTCCHWAFTCIWRHLYALRVRDADAYVARHCDAVPYSCCVPLPPLFRSAHCLSVGTHSAVRTVATRQYLICLLFYLLCSVSGISSSFGILRSISVLFCSCDSR